MNQQLEAPPETEAPAQAAPASNAHAFDPSVEHLLDIPVRAEAILGTLRTRLRTISSLEPGSLLRTTRKAGEPLDLLVNGVPLASTEVIPRNERLGLRVESLRLSD